ncbi:hypothetical protein NQ315_000295 [Exocentrus adspersus]|uniref:Ribosomal protein S14 n=1 Tax=Exocentrus adspersus TaxID=1586481 RepID=A0AAV8VR86_9CUCU|nr:hypothetical protein NQ315_000295 [Exocentrus adspersus]
MNTEFTEKIIRRRKNFSYSSRHLKRLIKRDVELYKKQKMLAAPSLVVVPHVPSTTYTPVSQENQILQNITTPYGIYILWDVWQCVVTGQRKVTVRKYSLQYCKFYD